MDHATIEKKVLAVLTAVLRHESELGADSARQNTLNWNSLRHLELMFALEEELQVEFSRSEFVDLDSIAKIVALIAAKLEI